MRLPLVFHASLMQPGVSTAIFLADVQLVVRAGAAIGAPGYPKYLHED
eukprot:CAMPEP_0168456870 /NCGR_PEP_ID=MMETSP0228-20121227/51530_1 /TAXON_ID=133427 /ORGANISM="Protoceratium reticulatum, Strain CCCM 535 (=CCMP 1889)" /LENGTH=47 /DNA_ID= /DNA_START= /DNA_END= /DNA_ORIENTATION=